MVRRVKRLQPGKASAQGELFDTYRYHAFITNSSLNTVDADTTHRDHAIVEQVFAELKANALAHLPSGQFSANAAWVQLAVIAFNLARAAAVAADMARARWSTERTRLIAVAARTASRARQLHLHLPRDWPWQQHWMLLWDNALGPPPRSMTS